jgi:hypothetical protein
LLATPDSDGVITVGKSGRFSAGLPTRSIDVVLMTRPRLPQGSAAAAEDKRIAKLPSDRSAA